MRHLLAARVKQTRFTMAALLLLLALAGVSAQGQTQITKCGTIITAPGEYVLANDLTNCQFGVIISRAPDVVLNLAGHRITGTTAMLAAGIKVQSGANRVRIQGPGVISNFTGQSASGIQLISGGTVEITAVTATGNDVGFFLHDGRVLVHGNIATNNVEGFYMVAKGELSDNMATGNKQDGIFAGSFQGDVLITHNTLAFNGQYGIDADRNAKGNDIISNTALDNVAFDLFDDNRDCRNNWAENTFGTSKGPCFH